MSTLHGRHPLPAELSAKAAAVFPRGEEHLGHGMASPELCRQHGAVQQPFPPCSTGSIRAAVPFPLQSQPLPTPQPPIGQRSAQWRDVCLYARRWNLISLRRGMMISLDLNEVRQIKISYSWL